VNSSTPTLQAVWAASSDTRELWSIVTLLAVLGVGLVMLAVAVYRVTRPDRELLAPLEVMGRRKWRRSDPVWQRRELDTVRPPGAEPLSPAALTPAPLEGFDEGPAAPGFDDLQGDHDILGADELFDVGVDAGLVGLPGGEVFDPDPTPPSTEVPVIVAAEARDDLSLAQLGVDWSPPAPEDLTAAAAAPLLRLDDAATDTAVDEETTDGAVDDETIDSALGTDTPVDGAVAAPETVFNNETADTAVDDATDTMADDDATETVADDDATETVDDDDTADGPVDDETTETADHDEHTDRAVHDEASDTVVAGEMVEAAVEDETTGTVG
jgi:hypothetical protein